MYTILEAGTEPVTINPHRADGSHWVPFTHKPLPKSPTIQLTPHLARIAGGQLDAGTVFVAMSSLKEDLTGFWINVFEVNLNPVAQSTTVQVDWAVIVPDDNSTSDEVEPETTAGDATRQPG